MLTLNDGRNELWQWDTGRKLTVDADCTQVHFSNKFFGRSVDVDVFDGTAEIPDVLLQVDKELLVWAFVGTAENGYTKISKVFKVNKRNKPADYVFTPPEQTTLGQIMERLDDLEAMQDPDAIKNAVDDYLANNPIKVEEKDPTVPEWAKQPTPPDVKIPDKLPNPHSITFTGAVNASYDGSDPVEITIPGSGGNVELDTTLTQSGKAADAKAVGDKIAEITGISLVEPACDDIPKVFFGGPLQQTKDEAVVPFRYISKTDDFSGYAEIKAQGHGSLSYPKKNQNVKLFKDAECTEKLKVDFKGWGKQNKHCYKANWVDLTHARNIVSARLWADVVKSRTNYVELPELLRTSPNQGAIDGFPVKVYAAGVYQGRYTLNIPKDKWAFNMDDDLEEHCVLYSENYGSGNFRAAANINGSDWTDEIHDVVPESIKTRWNEVISFVMNSTDDDFRANLNQYFFVDSLIDYYLYALAICGVDSLGRNQIFATYDGNRWIASAYDLDATWGLYYNGNIISASYDRNYFEDMRGGQGNLLYIRMEQLFWSELQTRWTELKNGALSIENIINRFERFTDIAPAELVKEDYASTTGGGAFTAIPSKDTNNIQQIRAFALERQTWTDEYIAGLTPEVQIPCMGISLNANTLTFTAEGSQTLTATVTPDGCTDKITWESNNTSVATVVDGVVTAVANGSATITAYCGEYSASCSVSVSGIENRVPCTGIFLSTSSLTFTDIGSKTLVATAEPTNTTDSIEWSVTPSGVVTVDGGVVTAVSSGSCVITAKCGEQSATCSVSVSLPVDYTLNPLANVEWQHDMEVNDSGALVSKAGENTSTRFTLQDCVYNHIGASGSSWAKLHVWDEFDTYLGIFDGGSAASIGEIVTKSGYSYAITYNNSTEDRDFSGTSLMPVDKRANAVDTITITLADLTWKYTNGAFEADISNVLAENGVNLATVQNGLVRASHLLKVNGTGAGPSNGIVSFSLYIYAGNPLLIAKTSNASSAEAFATWVEENNIVLTIN